MSNYAIIVLHKLFVIYLICWTLGDMAVISNV